MALPLLVAVDTNQLDEARIERIRSVIRVPFELACITVTARKRGEITVADDLKSVP